MTNPIDFPGPKLPAVAGLVGAHVYGSPQHARTVVRWLDLLHAAQGNDLPFNPDAEQYLTVYCYPRAEYIEHIRRMGSPRGYDGPAACPYLWFDIDNPADLEAARLDALRLARFLIARYGILAPGIGVWFSGRKGLHIALGCRPGYVPSPTVPATVKRLALALAKAAGVRIDPSIYDHQRLLRLPNSRHPRTGLHKRPLMLEELELTADRIRELARHPAGDELPIAGDHCQLFEDDWQGAAKAALIDGSATSAGRRCAFSGVPLVPDYVRRFIGFRDVQDPGRAVTLFRCAAVLAEAGSASASVSRAALPEREDGRYLPRNLAVEASLWTFATTPGVEPLSNAAELEVHHAMCWRKSSFGTDSERGYRIEGRKLTVVASCRKQNRDVLELLFEILHPGTRPSLAPIGA